MHLSTPLCSSLHAGNWTQNCSSPIADLPVKSRHIKILVRLCTLSTSTYSRGYRTGVLRMGAYVKLKKLVHTLELGLQLYPICLPELSLLKTRVFRWGDIHSWSRGRGQWLLAVVRQCVFMCFWGVALTRGLMGGSEMYILHISKCTLLLIAFPDLLTLASSRGFVWSNSTTCVLVEYIILKYDII